MMGGGETVNPLRCGGERDAVSGLAGPDAKSDRQVSLAGARRAEEDDVLFGGDEVQGAQVSDLFAFERAFIVEVELLQRFPRWKSRGPEGVSY